MTPNTEITNKTQCLEVIRKISQSDDKLDRQHRYQRFNATQYFAQHMNEFSMAEVELMFQDELVTKMINSSYAKPLLEQAIASNTPLKIYHPRWFQTTKENQEVLKAYVKLLSKYEDETQLEAMYKVSTNLVRDLVYADKNLQKSPSLIKIVLKANPSALSSIVVPEEMLIEYYKKGGLTGQHLSAKALDYSHKTRETICKIMVSQYLENKDKLLHDLAQAENFSVGTETKLADFLWELSISPMAYEFIMELYKQDPKLTIQIMASHPKSPYQIQGYNFIQSYLITELQNDFPISTYSQEEIYLGLKDYFADLIFKPATFHKGAYSMTGDFMQILMLNDLEKTVARLGVDYENMNEKEQEICVAAAFNVLIDRKIKLEEDGFHMGEENTSIPDVLMRCSLELFKQYHALSKHNITEATNKDLEKLLFKRRLDESLPTKGKNNKLKI